MIEKFNAYIIILRPSNAVLFFLGIMLGAVVSIGFEAIWNVKVLLASISGMLIGCAGNVINDVKDVDIDRINKPNRPIVLGLLSKKEATGYWLLLNAIGILIAGFLSLINVVIAASSVVILYAYSESLKRKLFVGNFVVCLIISTGFIYSAIAIGSLSEIWFPAIFSFFFNLAREILKDLEDVEGDKIGGANTIPIQFGYNFTMGIITVFFGVLIALSILPYSLGIYGDWYLIIVMLFVNTIIVFVTISAWRIRTKANLFRLNTILKVAMLMGIIAIALGKI